MTHRRLLIVAALCLLCLGLGATRRTGGAFLPLVAFGILARGRDPRREVEEQTAFEQAERERAERRADAVFESFVDSSPVGVEIFAADGTPLRSNKAAERLLGKVPPPGIPLADPRGLKRSGLLEPQLKRVLAGTRVETPPTWYDPAEIGLAGIPGRKVCFRATVNPLFENEGRVTRIAVIYEDLTELKRIEQSAKQAPAVAAAEPPSDLERAPEAGDARDIEFKRRKLEQALRESEERYRSLVDSARGYVLVRFSEDGHIIAISPSVEDYWGIKRETIAVDNAAYFSRIHPEDVERVRATEAEARKTGTYPPGYEFRVAHMATSAVTWLEGRGGASSFAGRRSFDLLLVDASDRKRIAGRLADRETRLAALLQSPHDGVVAIDKDWVITAWSKGAERETRVDAADALGKRLWDIYPDLERSGLAAPWRDTLLKRTPQAFEGFYQDGREKLAGWFSVTTYAHETGALGLIRNVSARKRAELAWQDADSKLRALLDQPELLITLKDHQLRYVLVNPAAQQALSFAAESIIGRTDPELFNATVSALLVSHDRQVIQTGKPRRLEIALPDGNSPRATWYRIIKQPWRNAAGQTIGVLDIAADITARVSADAELARRRAAFEQLVGEQALAVRRAQEELDRWKGPA